MPRASAGPAPGFLRVVAFGFVITGLLLPRFACAHTAGVSTADFIVSPEGRVEAEFVFASAEPLGALSLDRDHDGIVTAAETADARADLRAFLLDGVDVSADGESCPVEFESAELREFDGLVLSSRYRCRAGARTITATLYYLTALPQRHREICRITAASSSFEAVLTGDHRAISLRLPHETRPEQADRWNLPRTFPRATAVAAVILAAIVGFALVRRRSRFLACTTHRRKQG